MSSVAPHPQNVSAVAGSLDAAIEKARLELERNEADPWEGSPYQWVRKLQSRTRGKAGEMFLHTWLSENGFDVQRAGRDAGKHCDRIINGVRVEMKLSTLWATDMFSFSQLRDQDYERLALLAVEPYQLRVWFPPKAAAVSAAVGQHGGKSAKETSWLQFRPDEVPAWLDEFGGTEENALAYARVVFPPAER